MSFDVNVLSTKPVIKAAASMQNDGGGADRPGQGSPARLVHAADKFIALSIYLVFQFPQLSHQAPPG